MNPSTETQTVIATGQRLFMNTYGRYPVVISTGNGCILTDTDGKEYLDFLSGIAVCSLGHCHPAVTEAICRQAGKLVHVSNLYSTLPQTELAELLVNNSFADRVFFCNSGAEANEAAIKLARKHGGEGRYEILTLEGSFHGRTLATIAATGQAKFQAGFEPMPAGFTTVPFGDIAALAAAVGPETCGIMVEPLQGEGGVRPLSREYLTAIRTLCDEKNLVLIFDEVQVGMGRTGSLFAYQQLGVTPDIMTLAKALGNGLPIGAMLATEKVAAAFTPGSHASTFGGNPVASAAAVVVMQTMLADGFLKSVLDKGAYFAAALGKLVSRYPAIAQEVRGRGLIQGLVLTEAARSQGTEIVNRLFTRGFLINFAGNTALRFVPPLVVETQQIDTLITALDTILGECTDS